jgi:sec-independent protein translocase protein TatA
MLETIGWPELLVIAVVFVVLFGGKKIPEIGKGIGEGIKNFKAAMKAESESEKEGEKAVEKV